MDELATKKEIERLYNKQYYEKNKMLRREKKLCLKCGRVVCAEYLPKHRMKSICKNQNIIIPEEMANM
jgi:ribosomal protein S27AE